MSWPARLGWRRPSKQPDCEQIRQRFNAIARLEPLTSREIHDYIVHRLQTAGGSIDLFTRGAIDMIVAASGGMPRNVNTICFNSLTLAYALAKREAGTDEIAEALRDLNLTVGGAEPKPSRTTLELPLAFGQTAQSFRPAWIAGCLALLAACTFLLGRF